MINKITAAISQQNFLGSGIELGPKKLSSFNPLIN